jgi:SAGA-associated factor 73
MKLFGAQPLTSDIGLVKCKECEKPVLKSFIAEHSGTIPFNGAEYILIDAIFIKIIAPVFVQEARNSERGRVVQTQKVCKVLSSHRSSSLDPSKKGKKRKASPTPDDPSQPPKKKNKPMTKVTKGRFKGPVDYDKQCGVINDKNLPCSRSLTCKSHSMGAKRAVQGRSRPYGDLLLDWNRANNPNWVEPAKKETKAEKKEKREREKAEKKRLQIEAAAAAGIDLTKKGSGGVWGSGTKKGGKKAAIAAVRLAEGGEEVENLNDIDSEAEVNDLVKAVRSGRDRGVTSVPLAVPCDAGTWFVARKERLRTCRELLAGALTGNSGLAAAGAGGRLG